MDDDTQDRMFDPFFTTKEKGHGLGLAAALGIIRGHKGNVRVESTLGQGTIISVLLPAGLNAHIDEPSAKSALSEDDLHRHVLIVDDEHFVRNFVATALPKNNFTVYLAEHGQQAIDILNANKDIIDVVLLDLSMPEMSGEDVFGRLKSIRPDISIILSSGYAEADIEQRLGHHRPSAFLQKPYRSETLIVLIRDVLLSKTGS